MTPHTGETIYYSGVELRRLSARAATGILLGRVRQRLVSHGTGAEYERILARLKLDTQFDEAIAVLGDYVFLVDTDEPERGNGTSGAPVPLTAARSTSPSPPPCSFLLPQ